MEYKPLSFTRHGAMARAPRPIDQLCKDLELGAIGLRVEIAQMRARKTKLASRARERLLLDAEKLAFIANELKGWLR